MLETIMNSYGILWAMGITLLFGIFCKTVTVVSLKCLVKAAGKMGKSTHRLMKLVKAKFEHTYMLSNGVDNIDAFVDKYLYEYQILGLRLHTWRYLEKQIPWICGILGCIGAVIRFRQNGMDEAVFQYGALAAVGMMFLYFISQSTDEELQLKAARIYMVDYLENTCAPRYQKQQTLKLQRMEKMVEEDAVDVDEPEPEEKKAEIEQEEAEMEKEYKEETKGKVPQEVILREILEEFLA